MPLRGRGPYDAGDDESDTSRPGRGGPAKGSRGMLAGAGGRLRSSRGGRRAAARDGQPPLSILGGSAKVLVPGSAKVIADRQGRARCRTPAHVRTPRLHAGGTHAAEDVRLLQTLDLRTPQALDENLAFSEFLHRLLADEVERREPKQLSVIRGPTGVGKSHLAQALGHRACRAGHTVLYVGAHELFLQLPAACADASLEILRDDFTTVPRSRPVRCVARPVARTSRPSHPYCRRRWPRRELPLKDGEVVHDDRRLSTLLFEVHRGDVWKASSLKGSRLPSRALTAVATG